MNTKDSKGFTMVKQMIEDSVKNNEAYTNYYFPKEGETEPSPKRSYTYYYKEFDWVIGTGNYTDDIDKTVAVRHDELIKIFKQHDKNLYCRKWYDRNCAHCNYNPYNRKYS